MRLIDHELRVIRALKKLRQRIDAIDDLVLDSLNIGQNSEVDIDNIEREINQCLAQSSYTYVTIPGVGNASGD